MISDVVVLAVLTIKFIFYYTMQPHTGQKPVSSTGQLGLGAATKPVAFSILQAQPKTGTSSRVTMKLLHLKISVHYMNYRAA